MSDGKRFKITDIVTNETIEGYGLIVPRKAPHPYKNDGVQVHQAVLRDLAINPDLTKRALRIAIWLLSDLRRPPAIPATRQDIGRALNMDKSDVTKGLQELHSLGKTYDQQGEIFRPFLPPTARITIGVRPTVAWKGKSGDLVAAIEAEKRADALMIERTARIAVESNIITTQQASLKKLKSSPQRPPMDDEAMNAMAIIRDMASRKMVITTSSFRRQFPTEVRPSKQSAQNIFDVLLAHDSIRIFQSNRGSRGTVFVASPLPLIVQIENLIHEMEESGETITIRAIGEKFDPITRPDRTAIIRILNVLIGMERLVKSQTHKVSNSAVYLSPDKLQNDKAQPVKKAIRYKAPEGLKP